jgi:hypothetical protein
MTPERELTYGEKSVGLTFNPGNNPKVDEVKKLYAQIIDLCASERLAIESEPCPTPGDGERLREKARFFSIAITEAQTAQMWAVKAITK